jgi:hypothetical protein
MAFRIRPEPDAPTRQPKTDARGCQSIETASMASPTHRIILSPLYGLLMHFLWL